MVLKGPIFSWVGATTEIGTVLRVVTAFSSPKCRYGMKGLWCLFEIVVAAS